MPEVIDIDEAFAPEPWPWVSAVELDGEIVLFDESTGRVHLLNGSASIVWQQLDGTITIGDLATLLAEATATDRTVVRNDVLALARMFGNLGVLVGFEPAKVEPPAP